MKLKFDKAIKTSGKIALFIKCDYNDPILKLIQSYSGSYYHTTTRTWELKETCFPMIISEAKDCTLCGEIPKKYNKFLQLLDKYDTPDSLYAPVTTPFTHQLDCIEYSINNPKFLLADEQGLGKTKQALDIAVTRKHKMKHCLIVCGVNSLKYNWLEEVKVHTNEEAFILGSRVNRNGKTVIDGVQDRLNDLVKIHDEFFIITNVETLRDKKICKQIQSMCEDGIIGMTIIDEIHKCKNSTTSQGKAIHYCKSYYRLALTGTPLMNNPIDLYNILKWLGYENHTLYQFESRYCIKGGYGNYQIIGYKNLDELQHNLELHMLRRKKSEVLDLPDKIRTKYYVEMNKEQQQIYNEVLDQTQVAINKVLLSNNPLSQLTRLRQATSNPCILTSNDVVSSKYIHMKDIVDNCVDNGEKVIIFSNWTSVINPAFKYLEQYTPALVTGEVNNKVDEINRFKTDPKCMVILGTIPCLGTGFTLTEATTVIFLDEPWTAANKVQAEDRVHRIGTTSTVNIITLICKDTIDEKINKLVYSKEQLSDYLVDNTISSEDIKYLLS